LQKKIQESINYSPNRMADELRKGNTPWVETGQEFIVYRH
jgi:hypothetical protein